MSVSQRTRNTATQRQLVRRLGRGRMSRSDQLRRAPMDHVLVGEPIEPNAWLDSTRSCGVAVSSRRRPKIAHADRTFRGLRSHCTRTNFSQSLLAFALSPGGSITDRRHRRKARHKAIPRCRSSTERRPRRGPGIQLFSELHGPRSLQPTGNSVRLQSVDKTLSLRRRRLARS